jgi:hypothetical protein
MVTLGLRPTAATRHQGTGPATSEEFMQVVSAPLYWERTIRKIPNFAALRAVDSQTSVSDALQLQL